MNKNRWPFSKYVGCGNDFIIFDNRQNTFPFSTQLVKHLCHRHNGIGADGILLLELSAHADCRMRIFNADGSEAEMCGNGLRCFVKWLYSIGMRHTIYTIEVMHRLLKAWIVDEENIKIDMGKPYHFEWNTPITFQNETYIVHKLNTGVPHAVIFVKDIENAPIETLGPYVRFYPQWQPDGVNATFVQQCEDNVLKIRTFERGVEAETLACGTGAVAASLVTAYLHHVYGPFLVMTRSEETLKVQFDFVDGVFSSIQMTGPANGSFSGEVLLPQ